LPAGYAPFGIQNGGTIYVTYALQDEGTKTDRGPGPRYVSHDTAGNPLRRVASGGAPARARARTRAGRLGKFGGMPLVGNSGNGRINAMTSAVSGKRRCGSMHSAKGPPLRIDGLWASRSATAATQAEDYAASAGPNEESPPSSARSKPRTARHNKQKPRSRPVAQVVQAGCACVCGARARVSRCGDQALTRTPVRRPRAGFSAIDTAHARV
jgi:hypothetical protein